MSAAGLARLILGRLAVAIPLLLIITFGVFALVHLAPGDPGARAARNATRPTPRRLRPSARSINLNDPFIVQYWQMAVAGAPGRSGALDQRQPAGASALSRSGSASRSILTLREHGDRGLCVGGGLGMLAAFAAASRLDRFLVMFGVFGISSPAFVTGIFLLYFFGVVLGWFPTFGAGRGFLDRAWHWYCRRSRLRFRSWRSSSRSPAPR